VPRKQGVPFMISDRQKLRAFHCPLTILQAEIRAYGRVSRVVSTWLRRAEGSPDCFFPFLDQITDRQALSLPNFLRIPRNRPSLSAFASRNPAGAFPKAVPAIPSVHTGVRGLANPSRRRESCNSGDHTVETGDARSPILAVHWKPPLSLCV